MGKLLRIGDYILLSSALVGDALTEIKNVGEVMPAVMKARYGFVPPNYKKTNYLSAVSRLISVGDIERKIDGRGKMWLELTSAGREKYKRRFPILSTMRSKWDGYFMVVIFDIPEKERASRDILRTKLYELGFGMLQESVWISPYHFEEDLREFLVNHELGDKVFVLEAKKLLAGKTRDLVNKVWNLEAIEDAYQRILKHLEGGVGYKNIWEEYLSVLKIDPMVPEALYPMAELRKKIIAKLTNGRE